MAQHPEGSVEHSHRGPLTGRDVALVLWASFLTASGGTMLFFAFFDPTLLSYDDEPPHWLADRMTGYACGFFFFWALCSVAAFLTAFMIDTRTGPRD